MSRTHIQDEIPVYENGSSRPLDIWYCYKGGQPGNDLPAFFDNSKWEWVKKGEEQYSVFRNEIETYLTKKNNLFEAYFNRSLVESGQWETLEFFFWTKKNEANCTACPELAKWLATIPGLTSAGVSRLSPQGEIKPHPGDTNGIARCHLGISIPAGLPDCGIMVNGESRAWEEGKILSFCDAYVHSAWNRTDQFRYIMIIDVVLPRFLKQKEEIAANVQSFLKLQGLMERKPWVKKLPGFVLGIIRHFYKL
jgi:aspartyl/asparaginyl beta-hydroxylase (cupin superfamily)